MPVSKTLSSTAVILAAASMVATPAAAAELDMPFHAGQYHSAPSAMPQGAGSDYHRRYRRDHVDAGDVIAGVLILGTIAAIASSASKNSRDRDNRDRDRDYRDSDYRDRRNDSRYNDSRGIDRAVSMCVNEIERDVRVDSVDGVRRDGSGWEVNGSLYNGERFSCEIGSDGRIRDINFGGRSMAYADPVEDNQYSDDRYVQARARLDADASASASASPPAYPGSPLPDEEIDGDLAKGSDDGRYDAHTAPDFDGA